MAQVVLSYGDALLRSSDITLLDPPHWLNDSIIGFIFEFLASSLDSAQCQKVAFLSPEVSQFIKCCGTEAPNFLAPLDLASKDLVLLTVNDNEGPEAGGTHWSLLVYIRRFSTFLHYDSFPGNNAPHARLMAKNMSNIFGGKPDYKDEDSPVQHNSYDCGMYVVCVAEALCQQYLHVHDKMNLCNITPQFVTEKRLKWKEIIRRLSSNSTTS
ncbi:hypothetical protein GDO86_006140 [Hymenochirus boettgeri]|uniref:Ubiquitin-like protease family profile domain-containing protein n=1 Tax=Hymenochirus boettgeri TaxID=247094 RepID=A0A8T2J4W5_9PIPI|nr:hypothetical protein GDO86_006140 [Hymenochirus boettgeri]